MPYEPVTLAMFRARFPALDDTTYPDAMVENLLVDAHNRVDTTWREQDYQPAILYYTAHLVVTDNSQEGDDPEIGAGGDQVIASESFAGMSVSYANSNAGSFAKTDASVALQSTEYGRRFANLQKLNFTGPVVI